MRSSNIINKNSDNGRDELIKMTSEPAIRVRETQSLINPIWKAHRDFVNEFNDFKNENGKEIKTEIKKDAKSHLTLIYIAIVIISSLFAIIYNDIKIDLKQLEQKINK